MSYLIISKENCPFCVKAKNLFKLHRIPFTELMVPDDISRDEFITMMDEMEQPRTVPKIWEDNTLIGGHSEWVEFLKEKGRR